MMTADDLKARREALGLTQAELAERLGVNRRSLEAWEAGRYRVPHPRLLDQALTALEQTATICPKSRKSLANPLDSYAKRVVR